MDCIAIFSAIARGCKVVMFPIGHKGYVLTDDRMWPKRNVLYIIRSVSLRRF
jgi:hypothetical protein